MPGTRLHSMPSPRASRILAMVTCLALAGTRVAAGATPPSGGTAPVHKYPIRPVSGPITIDGSVDDPGWKDALSITDFYEFRPGDGIPARVKTEVRLAYDSTHLYMMARCYDPDPRQIRAHLSDRDHIFDDDFVGIQLDTFLDHRTGYEFYVNPLGIQGDLSVSNGGNEDASFDCLWQSAARIDSLGWTAEMAIPTKSIRFRNLPVTEWGFWAYRNYPREARYQIASHRMSRDEPCWNCQFDHLDSLRALVAGKNLEMLPYVTQSALGTRDRFGTGFQGSAAMKAGLSLKYGITPSLTLDGTVKPDFAQVEADENQITQNNQAALFFQEKRPFFLEGSSILQGSGNMFYSRSIAEPTFATKLTGRQGSLQLGALVAHDLQTPIIYPYLSGSEPVNVAYPSDDVLVRLRRDLLKDSNVGFTGTSRTYGPGGYNRLAALDGAIRLLNRMRWTWYVAGSRTRDLPGYVPDADTLDPDSTGWAMMQDLSYNSRHFNTDLSVTRKTAGYRADLGFQEENDLRIRESWSDLEYSPAAKVVDYWQPSLYMADQVDGRGRPVDRMFKPEVFVRFKHQWSVDGWGNLRRSRRESADRSAVIDTLRRIYGFNVQKRGSGLLAGSANVRVADDIVLSTLVLGKSVSWGGSTDLRPTANLLVSLSFQDFSLKDRGMDTVIVRQRLGLLRGTYQFTPRLFMRLLSQLVSTSVPGQPTARSLSNQFLLSYKINYATVFFLGLNGNYDNTLLREDGSDYETRISMVPTAHQAFAKFQYFWRY